MTAAPRLAAQAALIPGPAGLAGMACLQGHGAGIDQGMVAEVRKRLDTAAGPHR